MLKVRVAGAKKVGGEPEAVALFQAGGCDAIGTDDRHFTKELKVLGIPSVTPATCIACLHRHGQIAIADAIRGLEDLSPLMSEREYHTARLYLEKGGAK